MVGCPERIFIVFWLLLSPFIRNLYVTLTSRKTFVFPFNDFAFLNAIDKFLPLFLGGFVITIYCRQGNSWSSGTDALRGPVHFAPAE